MSNTISDLVKYLYLNYPFHGELSKARTVKMVYLADWRSCLLHGCQITGIHWYFNHYGPYVSDIINSIRKDDDFEVRSVTNIFGDNKELIVLKNRQCSIDVTKEVASILDYVIATTSCLTWDQFISLIYSTYPVVTQPRYTYLDLIQLSQQYKTKQETKQLEECEQNPLSKL